MHAASEFLPLKWSFLTAPSSSSVVCIPQAIELLADMYEPATVGHYNGRSLLASSALSYHKARSCTPGSPKPPDGVPMLSQSSKRKESRIRQLVSKPGYFQ